MDRASSGTSLFWEMGIEICLIDAGVYLPDSDVSVRELGEAEMLGDKTGDPGLKVPKMVGRRSSSLSGSFAIYGKLQMVVEEEEEALLSCITGSAS
jgi:hypothetical protein